MWLPLRTTRQFRTLILAAFVHQLNACPCGCLEHNGWYQAMRSLAVSASLVTPRLSTSFGSEDFRVEPDHCDGDVRLTFVGHRSSQLDFGTGHFCFATHANNSISAAVNISPDGSLVNGQAHQFQALEVRAWWHVLRI
jgi:hypothetical protein